MMDKASNFGAKVRVGATQAVRQARRSVAKGLAAASRLIDCEPR